VEIFVHPSPTLGQKGADVDVKTDGDLPRLVKSMARAMYEAPGVGLAATQVGVLKRVLVFDMEDELVVLCNPVVASASPETVLDDEGCLSLPGITVPVERPVSLVCEAVSLDGEPIRIEADDFYARVLSHEIDHLDGVLIIDRATPDERRAALRRYREVSEG
jgi:peptide deformylase